FKLLKPIIMREFILSIEKQIPPDSLYDLKSAARMPSYSENQSSRTVWGGMLINVLFYRFKGK
ncbi:hypothetical protein, partial [Bacteroides acidifaciens]|uniref:hypothetical protein n=1 Tax=Bacteroides acidifaciens TaxID=85831 RepID=UPI001C3F8821